MDPPETMPLSMDTTPDSFNAHISLQQHQQQQQQQQPSSSSTSVQIPNIHDQTNRVPPDKISFEEGTPPNSTSSPSEVPSTSSGTSLTSPPSASSSPTESNLARPANLSLGQDAHKSVKKSVLFGTVTVYHFGRSQGFLSIPSQGGTTLGMKRRHFLQRRLSVDLYEEVRRRSRREILLKIKLDKRKQEAQERENENNEKDDCNDDRAHCSSTSSSTTSNTNTSDSDDESYSDFSDISDAELENDSYIFLQPVEVKLRRSLLKASGVGRIDPKEKRECKVIRASRERAGCRCVDQCIPEYCECSRLGVNCHVDRASFPCGCISSGCRNPQGRTEFDIDRVKLHFAEKIIQYTDQVHDTVQHIQG